MREKKIFYVLFAICITVFSTYAKTIVFGITNVAVKDDFYTIMKWKDYLEDKTGYKIKLKITKSYDEMQYFIENRMVDIAYICGATYVYLKKDNADVKLLVVPYSEGKPYYYSYVIVPKDSKAKSILDLRNKRYAFSDPKSNSGSIAPSYYLYKKGYFYKDFFKEIIYTYSHAESMEAVADKFVDGASVDSLVYKSIKNINPKLISKVKVIQKLGPFPTTPIIYNDTLSKDEVSSLKKAFLEMKNDKNGKAILERLGVDYFGSTKNISYSVIENMIDTLKRINNIRND